MISASPIMSLLQSRSPTAIAEFVIAVIVDTIKRVSGGTFAHVGKKVFEYVPMLANFNAASTVVFEASNVWVPATLKHTSPGPKCRRQHTSARMTVLTVIAFEEKTTTGKRVSRSQIIAVGCNV